MKRLIVFIVSLLLSVIIVVILPIFTNASIEVDGLVSQSYINQDILDYSENNVMNYKIYDEGKLIGILRNKDALLKKITNYDLNVDFEYDKSKIGLTENIYIVGVLSNMIYENKDEEIYNYLIDNDCLGIETNCVEFSIVEGGKKSVYEKIYVLNVDDFKEAEDQFILNFISQDTLNKINEGITIDSPVSFGSVDTGISINESIEITSGIGAADEILTSVSEVYQFLCYGRNEERQYYTTKQGDTLSGVGYYFNNMSAKQIMLLNPDVIKDENQIINPGTVLNVTYYSSPITVTVYKERLAQETVFPDNTLYLEDTTIPLGQSIVKTEEVNGLRNVLYSEVWKNGVLQEGTELSSVSIKDAIQGVVYVGAGTIIRSDIAGSGNWHWPVSNPTITCNYTCYAGHGGVDFYNLYHPWDYALAVDSGIVIDTGWTDIGGYYARVDHNNGYITYYGHFNAPAYVTVGQSINAGEILGPIGMTGNATGPHVHFAMYRDGSLIDPCGVLECSLLY